MTQEQIAEELRKLNGEDLENGPRTFLRWAEAFAIFHKYEPEKRWAHVAGEHDIIFGGPDPRKVSLKDHRRLRKLGWHLDKDAGCFHKYT
jgi:hypothetical protein